MAQKWQYMEAAPITWLETMLCSAHSLTVREYTLTCCIRTGAQFNITWICTRDWHFNNICVLTDSPEKFTYENSCSNQNSFLL